MNIGNSVIMRLSFPWEISVRCIGLSRVELGSSRACGSSRLGLSRATATACYHPLGEDMASTGFAVRHRHRFAGPMPIFQFNGRHVSDSISEISFEHLKVRLSNTVTPYCNSMSRIASFWVASLICLDSPCGNYRRPRNHLRAGCLAQS